MALLHSVENITIFASREERKHGGDSTEATTLVSG